jgi:1,4-alpha-glucan branching enzyme
MQWGQNMAIKKQFLKSKPVCKVKFNLPKEVAQNAKIVQLLGDFNNWDTQITPMRKLKNGSFTACLDLQTGSEYQFRYLLDGRTWISDHEADKFMPTPYGDGDNSVVIT